MDETNFILNTNPNHRLTIGEMWKTNNANLYDGIEGYEVKKVYFDHIKLKNNKKVWEKIISKKVRPDWPPHSLKDESGNVNWPKRKNYLDDIEKWAKSFYNKEKAEKVIEYLEDKGRPIDKKPSKDPIAKNLQKINLQGDRKTFIDWIKKHEEKKYSQYPDRENKIQEIKDKMTEYYKNKKTPLQVTMDRYKVKGSLPKCDRIGIVSDAEYCGEKIPFCYEDKDKEIAPVEIKKNKLKGKITYPPKTAVWRRDPIWKIYDPLKKTDDEQAVLDNKKELDKERARSAKDTLISKLKVKNLDIQLVQTFNNMINFRKEKVSFGKLTYLNDEEKDRYKEYIKENPKKQPGATYYWKTKAIGKDFKKESSRKNMETVVNDNGTKTYYIERSVTDKIVSRPMSSHIF